MIVSIVYIILNKFIKMLPTCLCKRSGWGKINRWTLHTVGTNITTSLYVSCIVIPSNIGVSINLYLILFTDRFTSKLCSTNSNTSWFIFLKQMYRNNWRPMSVLAFYNVPNTAWIVIINTLNVNIYSVMRLCYAVIMWLFLSRKIIISTVCSFILKYDCSFNDRYTIRQTI